MYKKDNEEKELTQINKIDNLETKIFDLNKDYDIMKNELSNNLENYKNKIDKMSKELCLHK